MKNAAPFVCATLMFTAACTNANDRGAVHAPSTNAAIPHAIDAGISDAASTTVAWPSQVEFTKMGIYDAVGTRKQFKYDVVYPLFRAIPPDVTGELNATIAAFTKPSVHDIETNSDLKSGFLRIECELSLASPFAVAMSCRRSEHYDYGKNKSDNSDQVRMTWWLQPGLPPLTIDQFATRSGAALALNAATAASNESACQRCELSACSLRFDATALAIVPPTSCRCADLVAELPYQTLAPSHPWAKQLLEWIAKRRSRGELLVDGEYSK